MTQEEAFKNLVAHAKEYGFIFPSSEIYDGLSAVYDYGQNGVEMKNNIKKYWWGKNPTGCGCAYAGYGNQQQEQCAFVFVVEAEQVLVILFDLVVKI